MDKSRDFPSEDLPKDGKGRFDEFAMGVKRKFRPDWLDSENTMFINKLNFVTNNYEDTHNIVKGLKTTIYNTYKL